MKKIIISCLTVWLLFILQTSVFRFIAFGNTVPNLLLIAVVFYGLMRGEYSGIIAGFFCGLLMDIFFMNYIGFHAFIYMYIGFFNGKLSKYIIEKDYKIPLISVVLSDILVSLCVYLIHFVFRGRFSFNTFFTNVLIGDLIYTLVLAIILYPVLNLLEDKVVLAVFKKEDNSGDVI